MLVSTSFAHFHRPLPRRPSRALRRVSFRSGGESRIHGWIIDAYGDYDRDSMVLWLWTERGAHRIEDPRFLPTCFLHAAAGELPEIRRRTEILDGVREVREVPRRIALETTRPGRSWKSSRGTTATSARSRTSSI